MFSNVSLSLKDGASWKTKNKSLILRDAACVKITKKLRQERISVSDYIDRVINIMNSK